MNAQKWDDLRYEFIQRIDELDRATPYQSVEPEWWLQMQKARRQLATPPLKRSGLVVG